MSNSILNSQLNATPNPANRFNPEMVQQFNQFRRNFNGNPQQAVMNLIKQGMMSNEQFQQLSQMASQFQNFMR